MCMQSRVCVYLDLLILDRHRNARETTRQGTAQHPASNDGLRLSEAGAETRCGRAGGGIGAAYLDSPIFAAGSETKETKGMCREDVDANSKRCRSAKAKNAGDDASDVKRAGMYGVVRWKGCVVKKGGEKRGYRPSSTRGDSKSKRRYVEMVRGRNRKVSVDMLERQLQCSKRQEAEQAREKNNERIPPGQGLPLPFPSASQAIEFPTSAPSNQQNKPAQPKEWG